MDVYFNNHTRVCIFSITVRCRHSVYNHLTVRCRCRHNNSTRTHTRITSYNVCYTKLLRKPVSIFTASKKPPLIGNNDPLAPRGGSKNEYSTEFSVISYCLNIARSSMKVRTSSILASPSKRSVSSLAAVHGPRITSYNVCYTKLLRIQWK